MVWFGGSVTYSREWSAHTDIMKPNDDLLKVGNNQIIYPNQEVPVKTEGDSSPASEALQLIFSESGVDHKAIMFDLGKFLQENPSLAMVNNQQRVIVSAPPSSSPNNYSQMAGFQGGVAVQGGVPIPKRQNDYTADLMDDGFSGHGTTPSSSGAAGPGGSSYGTSPRTNHSPSYWDQSSVQIKEEDDPPGLSLAGGHSAPYSPGDSANHHLFTLQNATDGPTLAQLNSPPTHPDTDITESTLRNLGDLDSLNLDLDALTGDIIFPFHSQISEIKVETLPPQSMFQWGHESQLSTSVPVSVISNTGDFQGNARHSGHAKNWELGSHTMGHRGNELSNLSNGGPAVSPGRLTLSPPARTTLSPLSQPLSPQMQGMIPSTVPARMSPHSNSSALHELLLRQDTTPPVPDPIRSRSNSNQFKSRRPVVAARQRNSLSISNPLLASQLSKSAPVKTLPIEQMIWSRRDPRPHMNSVCSNAGDSSIADEVSDVLNSMSPNELVDINSETEQSDNELDSDEDLQIDEDDNSSVAGGSSKKERYFWQYNVQAKGPKGQKLALDTKISDPHRLNDIIDPVFSDNVQVHGIKHSGKARRGDGNDLTANPKKLAAIGKELEKLNKEINMMTPVSEVPFTTRTKSRKEKNKLASRACRLKKKAQHEANKLKLHGLEEEHNDLMRSIYRVKEILHAKWGTTASSSSASAAADGPRSQDELSGEADRLLKKATKNKVAGFATDYVNRMIAKYS